MIIAMDGTAASGKSTIARGLAAGLSWSYLNSGELYRGWTYCLLKQGVDPTEQAVEEYLLTESGPLLARNGAEYLVKHGDEPLKEVLVSEEVNRAVSKFARLPRLREVVTAALRAAVNGSNAVVEGRDIGTAVFPDAPLKFFLDADLGIRRQRRSAQGLQDEIKTRDEEDSTRLCAPLATAPDAVRVDTGNFPADVIVGMMLDVTRERLSAPSATDPAI